MKAVHLQTEYLTEPLGLGIPNPRFYWNCEEGVHQSAYQIIATRDAEIIWDSGKVESSSMSHICYGGAKLTSRDRIAWSVTLWDENDIAGEKTSSWFEMGLLNHSDWKAKWIAGDYQPKKNVRYPADYFRKKFSLTKVIEKARLYITACGIYEAYINDRRVGDFVLAPGWTDYRRRIQYQTYDITEILQSENTIEIKIADGYFRGSVGNFGKTNAYGRQTKALCQLEIFYTDGSTTEILSDELFSWSNDGPVRFADLKDGEIFDAALSPSYNKYARVVKEALLPVVSNNVGVKQQERFHAQLVVTPSGKRVLDFGQNIAGFLSFSIKGEKGQKVHLFFGEMLDAQGEFSQKNIHKHRKPVKEIGKLQELMLIMGQEQRIRGEMQPTPKQELVFYCSGDRDTYQMSCSVFGFQYVLVDSEIPFEATDFEAIAVYSAMEEAGTFSCSNPDINRLLNNSCWSFKGNAADVPTDCPTRERNGWLGEGQVFFQTANYMMSAAPFYRKWLSDIADAQLENGCVPAVVPYVGFSMLYNSTGNSVGWADAMVFIPYRFWKLYGDVRILEDCYAMMRRYAMFMIRRTGQKDRKLASINPYNKYTYEKGFHLGDWLEPKEFQDEIKGGKLPLQTEVCTAYLHYTMTCMHEIAVALGKNEDANLFCDYAEGSKKAYHWLFLRSGVVDTDRQAKLVRPLAMSIVSGELKAAMEERLSKAVIRRGYCVGTGFLSTPFVLPVLSNAGRADLAYAMLENEKTPSWLAEVKSGATTMWEDWEGSEYASRNHYAQGAVCEWLFSTVVGIRVDGENHFKIAPIPGGRLTFAKAKYRSIYGEVSSSWEKIPEGILYQITIPSNTTALIILSGDVQQTVTSGTYRWLKSSGDTKNAQ